MTTFVGPPPLGEAVAPCCFLLLAGSRLGLGQALVAEFPARWFGLRFHVVRCRPIGAVPAPVPCVTAPAFPVRHENHLLPA